jgi:hypothetical protein
MRLKDIIVEDPHTEGFKDVWDKGVEKVKKIFTPSPTSSPSDAFDSVDPIKMKELIKNVLAGKELTPLEAQMLKDLYRKL